MNAQGYCPHCLKPVEIPLPVEPLYDLTTAQLLIPCGRDSLISWLSRHKDKVGPAQYKWHQRQRRRLLTATDIRIVREHMVSTCRFPGYKRMIIALQETAPPPA